MNSPLARYAHLGHEPDPDGARKRAAKAYHDTGFIALNPDWITSWEDRAYVQMVADKVHGKRGKK